MTLDDDRLWDALRTRDPRFDGEFYVGVSSTGVYCRCICPARTPARANCTFLRSAAAAEAAGFRPCLRCRPELAPGMAPVDAPGRLARAAFARIEAGGMDGDRTAVDLAESLGTTDRHLRRVLAATFGASPGELALATRLRAARRLLASSKLTMKEIAEASGFGSVRRMQTVFAKRYGMPPTRWRTANATSPRGWTRRGDGLPAASATFRLAMRPPVAWDRLLAFLDAHRVPGVERVDRDAGRYVRTLRIAEHTGWVAVEPRTGADPSDPERPFEIIVRLSGYLLPVAPVVLSRLRHVVDADARPDAIHAALAADPHLGPSLAARPGLRVPGAADALELAVRVVLGQQVSVASAARVHARVAEAYGERMESGVDGLDRLPPMPSALAGASPTSLGRLGVIRARAEAIRGIAGAIESGELLLDPGADPDDAMRILRGIRGVGPWTAGCIAMRGLGWPDAWPAGDRAMVVAAGVPDARTLDALAEAWRPWRAYAAIHLWHESIEGTAGLASLPRSKSDTRRRA